MAGYNLEFDAYTLFLLITLALQEYLRLAMYAVSQSDVLILKFMFYKCWDMMNQCDRLSEELFFPILRIYVHIFLWVSPQYLT